MTPDPAPRVREAQQLRARLDTFRREFVSHDADRPCGVHAEPRWTCAFCLWQLVTDAEAFLDAAAEREQELTLLDYWNYSGLPSVASYNHAVDVVNANYQKRLKAEAQVAALTARIAELEAATCKFVDKWEYLANEAGILSGAIDDESPAAMHAAGVQAAYQLCAADLKAGSRHGQ